MKGVVISALLALGAGRAYAHHSDTASAGNDTWAAEGMMADACQCDVFCPCEFASKPTFGHCDDAAILDIRKGHFGDVDLDGQKVVIVSQSPHGERLVDTVGRLNFARIYVPETATDAQVEALAELARRIFGQFVPSASRLSRDEKVERVKMEIIAEEGHYTARIPDVLEVDMAGVIGGDGKSPILVRNNAFAAIGCGDITVSQSKTYRYTGNGQDWNYGGRSASIRPFRMGAKLGEGPMALPAADPATEDKAAPAGGGHHHH